MKFAHIKVKVRGRFENDLVFIERGIITVIIQMLWFMSHNAIEIIYHL